MPNTDDEVQHKATDAEVDHLKQRDIQEVEEVDLSVYDFTEEESRQVVRKFDWHVSRPEKQSLRSQIIDN